MELNTPRLRLREFAASDWAAVQAYQSSGEFLRYYPWNQRTASDAEDFVSTFLRWQEERPRVRFQLAIELDGRLVGNCGVRRRGPEDPDADVGYEIAPAQWGHGYATEATAAIIDFGFREMGLHRVSAWCIADNAASARVLEKLGFEREGRLRDRERFKGRFWDTLLYGLLRRDWRPPTSG